MSFIDWQDKIKDFKKVDVRGIQGNFFPGLKQQAAKLPVGAGLEVVQNFDPIPLYEVMQELGFEYHTEQTGDADHAYFYKTTASSDPGDIPMRRPH